MFGGKKIDDEEWCAKVSDIAAEIELMCQVFSEAGLSVAKDPISGWRDCEQILASFGTTENRISQIKSELKAIGSPKASPELRQAASMLGTFIDLAKTTSYWAKLHYKDASGGPGQRALYESGFAQRAATARILNNGTQFAENAGKASHIGRQVAQAIRAHSSAYRPASPSLWELFVVSTGAKLPQSRREALNVGQVATIGSWCFREAAILGMLLKGAPETALASVWDPERSSVFVERLREWTKDFPTNGEAPTSLGFTFLTRQHPEIYAPGLDGTEPFEKALKRSVQAAEMKVSMEDARAEWGWATAMGYGLGVFHPFAVRAALTVEEEGTDQETWAEAYAAGLDIPAKQEPVKAQDQVDDLIEMVRPFLRQFYPEAFAVLRTMG